MNLLFGSSLDGAPCPSSWMEPGRMVCGPEGLLNALEVALGIAPLHGSTEIERLIAYREALRVHLEREPSAFYRRSFETESFSSSQVLLGWRDELCLAGWRSEAESDEQAPARLRTLAKVETAAGESPIFSGPAERIDRILEKLSGGLQSGIDTITVVDPEASFPFKWRQLFDSLGARFDSSLPDEPLAPPGSQLHGLQSALLGIERKNEPTADESVRVVEGFSEVDLARALANTWSEAWLHDAAFIASADQRSRLNDFFRQKDLPNIDAGDRNLGGVLSQLLPLSLRLIWQYFDPQAWLEFFLHPVGPVPKGLRVRLARAVDEMPGLFNAGWERAIERARESVSGDEERSDRLEKAISEWIELREHCPREGAPIEAVTDVALRLAGWMKAVGKGKLKESPDEAQSWLFTAKRIEEFVKALGRLDRITRQELERLLSLWVSGAERGMRSPGELGCATTLTSPGQILEPVSNLYWWAPSDSGVRRPPWTAGERDWLSSRGVMLVSTQSLLEAEEAAGCRAVLLASNSLTLWLPKGEKGARVAPVVTRIHAELKSASARDATSLIRVEPIAVQPLPEPRRWWQLSDPELLVPRKSESFSSLSKAIYSPYQWLLTYQAKLEASAVFQFGVGDTPIRRGIILHELAGELLAPTTESGKPNTFWMETDEAGLHAWIRRCWPFKLAECAAHFHLPGYESARNRMLHTARRSLWQLVEHLQRAGVTAVEVEKAIGGIPLGEQELNGRIDLVVRTPESVAVIDLKLGGKANREAELQENRHLQLAVYGQLLKESECIDPGVAFYILGNSTLLTRSKDFFPDAYPVSRSDEGDETEWSGCWEEFLKVWGWRKSQFSTGLIEVTTSGTEPDRTPPLEHWKAPEGSDAYNEFDALTGWPRTA